MDYKEFKNSLIKELTDKYLEKAQITINEVTKNNGLVLDGIHIVFKDDDSKIVPVIYLNQFYDAYSNGNLSIDEITDQIVSMREKAVVDAPKEYIDLLTKWDNVKNNIYPMLVATKGNENLLKSLLTRPFLDLSIIYMIRIGETKEAISSVKITENLAQTYNVDEETVYETAMENLEKDEYSLCDIREVISEMMGLDSDECEDDELSHALDDKMYVLTNKIKMNGAAGMLNMNLIGEKFKNRSFYILPSSIHELILVPYQDEMSVDELNAMIQEVNRTQLSQDEILSEHAYFYDGSEVSCAA